MAVFPITYMMVVVFFVFITYENIDYWARVVSRFLGVMLGFYIAITSIAGEVWLSDASGTLTVVKVNDGFALPLSLVVLGLSIYTIFLLMQSLMAGDYRKQET